jgi:CRISPR-associated protein Csd1
MLLRQLVELSERPDFALPPSGYAPTPIRYIIELDAAGQPLKRTLTDTADPSRPEARRGRQLTAPALRRTSAVAAVLLADNATYVLGWPKDSSAEAAQRARECQRAFRDLVADCAQKTGLPSVAAVARFLERDPCAQLELGEDFDPSAIITFRVEGELPFEQPAVRAYWLERTTRAEERLQCLVCGELRPALPRLPTAIKGLPGGQPSGTALISANDSAFESYGLQASLIAPICRDCAERSHHVLNRLLRSEQHHLRIGPAVFVYWTRDETPFSIVALLDQPQPQDVEQLLRSVYGGPTPALEANRFYATVLSGNGGRAQVRAWLDTTLGEAQANLARWFKRQAIVGAWGEQPRHLGVRALAEATVRDIRELAPPVLPSLIMAALGGQPLPPDLAQRALLRTRAEGRVEHRHAALLKLVRCGQYPEEEDTMVRLDLSNEHPAYLCGRLLAELEQAQRAALPGAKAGIVDRYYGTACTAPASIFGTLIQNAQAHLAKLERDNPGAYYGIQSTLEDILSRLPAFPLTLSLSEQSLFALGYYHQRAYNRDQALTHGKEKQA